METFPILNVKFQLLNAFLVEMLFNEEIDGRTKIGEDFHIDYPYVIIINSSAIIGNNVTVKHQVTIGYKWHAGSGNPTIGEQVLK